MSVDAELYLVRLQRWALAKALRRKRHSLSEIARVLGVTRQRVHVLLKRRSPPYPQGTGTRLNPKRCRRMNCNRVVAVRGLCPVHYLEVHSADRDEVHILMEDTAHG